MGACLLTVASHKGVMLIIDPMQLHTWLICSYLVEVIADGENLGKVQFISYCDTVKDVVEEFMDDKDVKEDLNVELTQKFSPKFKEFARIRNDAVLADGNILRAVFCSSSDHGNPPAPGIQLIITIALQQCRVSSSALGGRGSFPPPKHLPLIKLSVLILTNNTFVP